MIFYLVHMSVYFLVLFAICHSIDSKTEVFIVYRQDNLYKGFSATLKEISRVTCGYLCVTSIECFTFAYHRKRRECYFYDTYPDCGSPTPDPWLVTFLPYQEENKQNVALRKPTSMSSKYPGPYESCRSVDGNLQTFSHSKKEALTWWCVDLQKIYSFSYIVIHNRNDNGLYGTFKQLNGFEIRLSPSGQCDETTFNSAIFCYQDPLPTPIEVYNVSSCNQFSGLPFSARFIFIKLNPSLEYLHFTEISVTAI